MPDEMEQLNVVQDGELLHESIRAMKQISTSATSPVTLHALLGHLAEAGHLLPEVLEELGESLTSSFDPEKYPDLTEARLTECQQLLTEAADLAFRAGTVLGQAKLALEVDAPPSDAEDD